MNPSLSIALGSQCFAPLRNRWLGQLPPHDFELIANHLLETHVDRGAVLHEAGEPIRRIYFLCGGLVSLVASVPEGHAIDTVTVGRDGAVGLSAAIGSRIAWSRAVVQLPGHALHIPTDRLAELADRSASVRALIARYGDMLLAEVQQTVACNTVHSIQARMCRWLLQAHDRTDSDNLALTQELLSGVLGVQRTTITLVSRILQSEGILHVRRGRIQIRDVAALAGKACDCYRMIRRLAGESGRDPAQPVTPPQHLAGQTGRMAPRLAE